MTNTADLTDEQYELADALGDLIDAAGTETWWTPSQLARKVKVGTTATYPVLNWLVTRNFVIASGNGAWTKYSARRPLRIGAPDPVTR
jgi:hypothetical protein